MNYESYLINSALLGTFEKDAGLGDFLSKLVPGSQPSAQLLQMQKAQLQRKMLAQQQVQQLAARKAFTPPPSATAGTTRIGSRASMEAGERDWANSLGKQSALMFLKLNAG